MTVNVVIDDDEDLLTPYQCDKVNVDTLDCLAELLFAKVKNSNLC